MSVWDKFFADRTKNLSERFPGWYRALVVETNDPLNSYRVRFKCPELHNYNLKADECPWAVPAADLGGSRTGSWTHPCIGDYVWITFEKQHPYGPIWVGFANPTRRKSYTYQQIYTKSSLAVNENGQKAEVPIDYDEEYLPEDGRPMSVGAVDKYGNLDMMSAVGFFPTTHGKQESIQGIDPIANKVFESKGKLPKINKPDKKYMVRMSKYGNMILSSDVGYQWFRNAERGEFEGDSVKDEKYETKRWKYLQRLINEDDHGQGIDQRRIEFLTRYGHLFEMRDVGWSKTRPGEFDDGARTISDDSYSDYRWIKLRSKGGHLFQMYDKGSHSENDLLIKKTNLDAAGVKIEREDEYWKGKDARFIRYVSRHGFKIVIDDRGSHTTDATGKEDPHGNGILFKGRRSASSKGYPQVGNPRGFYWEFNENDLANHTSWGSPLGQSIEINDRYQYMMMATTLGRGWPARWQGIKENEFIRKPTMLGSPELTSHHLKLDLDNEYIRLKTRAGRGVGPDKPATTSGLAGSAINQGFEARDGNDGDGPWVELVDSEHRGVWFSKRFGISVMRAGKNKRMYMLLDDRNNKIVLLNNEAAGSVEIFCNGKVNISAGDDINLISQNNVNIRANGSINMQAGSTYLTVGQVVQTNVPFLGDTVRAFVYDMFPGPGAGTSSPGGTPVATVTPPSVPSKLEPSDRGKTYNGPYEECPRPEVEHQDNTK